MKKCPFCAEEIQDEAVKCKHGGEFLDGFVPPSRTGDVEKMPWYFRTSFIVIAVCSVGPLALPLIWWRTTGSGFSWASAEAAKTKQGAWEAYGFDLDGAYGHGGRGGWRSGGHPAVQD